MIFDRKPAIIGHRGSGRHADSGLPENTIASFLTAVEAGASWVEVDVQRTGDDRVVARHDPTGPDGAFLIDHPAERVTGTGVHLLTEVFAALDPGIGVNVDVKTILEDAVDPPGRRTDALLAPILAAEARRRPLLVTSFDAALLCALKTALPGLATGLLTWHYFPLRHAVAMAAGLGLAAIALHEGSFERNRVESKPVHRPAEHSVEIAHRAGLEVLAWCPSPARAVRLRAAGVDALVVDDVTGVVAALQG